MKIEEESDWGFVLLMPILIYAFDLFWILILYTKMGIFHNEKEQIEDYSWVLTFEYGNFLY